MVDIRYHRREGFRVWVRDDGIDIYNNVIRNKPPARHFGLHGWVSRPKAVRGRLEVRSKAGEGTVVALNIPAGAAYATARGRAVSRLRARPHPPDGGLAL